MITNKEYYNIAKIDKKEILIPGFNLVYGKNGKGKTMLLEKISDYFKSPIFNFNNFDNIFNRYENTLLLKNFYRTLTGRNEIVRISDIDNFYYILSIALTYGFLEENIILLDNMCWGAIDYKNKINIIENLSDFSYNNSIVITTCHEDIKKLVKTRITNLNIIDL